MAIHTIVSWTDSSLTVLAPPTTAVHRAPVHPNPRAERVEETSGEQLNQQKKMQRVLKDPLTLDFRALDLRASNFLLNRQQRNLQGQGPTSFVEDHYQDPKARSKKGKKVTRFSELNRFYHSPVWSPP
ncbi:hypothetical protein R1flu_013814 [Riccia fluitans]|uniref:Uncharacterized protein n=1 Tax=Riccia fluitans TaxID=41844 RepID=A0ABD1YEG9_9MARC